mmetsp:Transcript_65594/g.156504  ORF Transcript_65594/g.156504 Transcript_65594/m.156504 type:complete len:491 (+) Transcript_65594:1074-2546(+)
MRLSIRQDGRDCVGGGGQPGTKGGAGEAEKRSGNHGPRIAPQVRGTDVAPGLVRQVQPEQRLLLRPLTHLPPARLPPAAQPACEVPQPLLRRVFHTPRLRAPKRPSLSAAHRPANPPPLLRLPYRISHRPPWPRNPPHLAAPTPHGNPSKLPSHLPRVPLPLHPPAHRHPVVAAPKTHPGRRARGRWGGGGAEGRGGGVSPRQAGCAAEQALAQSGRASRAGAGLHHPLGQLPCLQGHMVIPPRASHAGDRIRPRRGVLILRPPKRLLGPLAAPGDGEGASRGQHPPDCRARDRANPPGDALQPIREGRAALGHGLDPPRRGGRGRDGGLVLGTLFLHGADSRVGPSHSRGAMVLWRARVMERTEAARHGYRPAYALPMGRGRNRDPSRHLGDQPKVSARGVPRAAPDRRSLLLPHHNLHGCPGGAAVRAGRGAGGPSLARREARAGVERGGAVLHGRSRSLASLGFRGLGCMGVGLDAPPMHPRSTQGC